MSWLSTFISRFQKDSRPITGCYSMWSMPGYTLTLKVCSLRYEFLDSRAIETRILETTLQNNDSQIHRFLYDYLRCCLKQPSTNFQSALYSRTLRNEFPAILTWTRYRCYTYPDSSWILSIRSPFHSSIGTLSGSDWAGESKEHERQLKILFSRLCPSISQITVRKFTIYWWIHTK